MSITEYFNHIAVLLLCGTGEEPLRKADVNVFLFALALVLAALAWMYRADGGIVL